MSLQLAILLVDWIYQKGCCYPSSHNHGSVKMVVSPVITFQIQPFSTSRIMEERVSEVHCAKTCQTRICPWKTPGLSWEFGDGQFQPLSWGIHTVHVRNEEIRQINGNYHVFPCGTEAIKKKCGSKWVFEAKLIHQTPHASILGKVIHLRHTFVIHMVCWKVLFVIMASQPGPSPLLTPWLVNHWFPLIRPLLNPYFPKFNALGAGALPKTSARTFSAKVLMKKVHHHLTILRQDIRQWIRG